MELICVSQGIIFFVDDEGVNVVQNYVFGSSKVISVFEKGYVLGGFNESIVFGELFVDIVLIYFLDEVIVMD